VEPAVDLAFQKDARDAAGDTADNEKPRQPPVRIGADFAFHQAGPPGAEQANPIRGEEPQDGQKRAHVQGDVERQARERRIAPAKKPGDNDQVGRAGNGDVLGQSLDNPQDNSLQDGWHGGSVDKIENITGL
jgi:hypothetical protein